MNRELVRKESEIVSLKKELSQIREAAEFGKLAMEDEKSTHSFKEVADLLITETGMGRNQLMEWLRERNVLLTGGNTWNMPSVNQMKMGRFQKVMRITKNGTFMTTVVTNKGIAYMIKKWMKEHKEKYRIQQLLGDV